MVNGFDRNWVRLCNVLEHFRAKYGRWPTRVLIGPGYLENLRSRVFSPETFQRLNSVLPLIAGTGHHPMVAEDDCGNAYPCEDGSVIEVPGDVSARSWLRVTPDGPGREDDPFPGCPARPRGGRRP
jgi:hypothetical protein